MCSCFQDGGSIDIDERKNGECARGSDGKEESAHDDQVGEDKDGYSNAEGKGVINRTYDLLAGRDCSAKVYDAGLNCFGNGDSTEFIASFWFNVVVTFFFNNSCSYFVNEFANRCDYNFIYTMKIVLVKKSSQELKYLLPNCHLV